MNIELENLLSGNEFPSSSTVLGGDFNVNLLMESEDVEGMLDLMRSHHFLETILSITRPGSEFSASSLIDHIWINQLNGYNCGVIETGITVHHSFFIKLPFIFRKTTSQKIKITFRDLSDVHKLNFHNNLSNFNWDNLKSNDINQYSRNFVSTLNDICQKSFPVKSKYVTENFFRNPWYTNDVKKLSLARNQYNNLLQENLVTHAEYRQFRNKITNLIRKCKENYYNNLFTRNLGNIKTTWRLINSICNRKKHSSIHKIVVNDVEIVNPAHK